MAEEKILTAKAHREHVRISTRKVLIVLDLIRGKDVELAKGILKNTRKSASEYILKLVKEAEANAENNFGMNKDKLYVSECYATPGMTMKRIMPRAQGRAFRILKRTSHITVVVRERD
ncbi:MAG: 50S ribosomal protein L22 [Ruminococcaceae bacterium]|nr:50S ribosomal protein L22 [Oscillospiraceae bacterium]